MDKKIPSEIIQHDAAQDVSVVLRQRQITLAQRYTDVFIWIHLWFVALRMKQLTVLQHVSHGTAMELPCKYISSNSINCFTLEARKYRCINQETKEVFFIINVFEFVMGLQCGDRL